MTLFLDISPAAGGTMAFVGIAVLVVFIGAAFVAFKLLKKSVKMAFRVAVVALILAIGVAGSAFFFAVGTSKPTRTSRPVKNR